MTGFRLNKRTRTFLLWSARLAFLAYLFQLMAIDHWHVHPADIVGIEGTSAHVAHCHGGGDCSDSGALAGPAVTEQATLPLSPPTLPLEMIDDAGRPTAVFIETPYHPPRAS